MATLARMMVELGLDASSFQKDVRGMNQAVDSSVGRIARSLGKLGSGFNAVNSYTDRFLGFTANLGDTVGLMLNVAGGFDKIKDAVIGTNANLESTTLAFDTLMVGGIDEARKHVEGLFEFAAKTPFETEPILNASRNFQTFGKEALNTQENLLLMGNATAAVNEDFERVSFWTGRLYSALQSGQPFGEAAANLTEMGIAAPETIAQMQKLQEQGAAGTEIWKVWTEDMKRFDGAMKTQSQTFSGLASTFSDQFSMMLATGLQPFFEISKEALGFITEWFARSDVQEGIQNFANSLRYKLGASVEWLNTTGFPILRGVVEDLASPLATIRDGIITFAQAVSGNWEDDAEKIRPIHRVIGEIGTFINENLLPAFDDFSGWMEGDGPKSAEQFIGSIDKVLEVLANLMKFFNDEGPSSDEFIKNLEDSGKSWDSWRLGIAKQLDLIEADWDVLVGNFETREQALSANLSNNRLTWERYTATVQGNIETLTSEFSRYAADVQKQAEAIRQEWNLYVSRVSQNVRAIQGEINTLINGFIEYKNRVIENFNAVDKNITDGINRIHNAIRNFVTTLTNLSAEFRNAALNIGRSIVNGIVEGASNLGGRLAQKLRDSIQKDIDTVKNFFGIRSPSKYMMDEVGKPLMEGIPAGAEAEKLEAQARLTNAVSDAILKAIEAVKGLVAFQASDYEVFEDTAFNLMEPVEWIIQAVQETAAKFKQKGLQAAADFSESIKKVLDLIKPAVDSVVAMAKYQELDPSFFEDAPLNLMELVEWIVGSVEESARKFSTEGLQAASNLASNAKTVLELIKPAIESVIAFSEFEGGVIQGPELQTLVENINLIVIQIQEAAEGFSEQGLEAATNFSSAAGESLEMVSNAVEMIEKIKEIAPLERISLQTLVGNIWLVVYELQEAAKGFREEGLKALEDFANTTNEAFSAVEKALDVFEKLQEFKGVPELAFLWFREGVYVASIYMQETNREVLNMLGYATSFADNMEDMRKEIERGLAEMAAINDMDLESLKQKAEGAVEGALAAAKDAAEIASPSKRFAREVGVPIVEGIAKGILDAEGEIQEAIQKVLDLGGILGNIGSIGSTALKNFFMNPTEKLIKQLQDEIKIYDKHIEETQSEGIEGYIWRQGAQDQLNKALEQQAKWQEKINELENAQQRFSYLQQQIKLIQDLAKYGINAREVLGDMQLGLNADPMKFLEASIRGTEAILARLNGALTGGLPNISGQPISMLENITGMQGGTQLTVNATYANQPYHSLLDDLYRYQLANG